MSNVYWSIFFLLTGFHGAHVIVGTLFLQFNFVRAWICRIIYIPNWIIHCIKPYIGIKNMVIDLSRYGFTTEQHLGLEAALYYWHFVDAVWILLYMIVYLS